MNLKNATEYHNVKLRNKVMNENNIKVYYYLEKNLKNEYVLKKETISNDLIERVNLFRLAKTAWQNFLNEKKKINNSLKRKIKMKTNVQEIYKILNLPDVFTRLEMDTSQLKPIEHLLTPFLDACQNNSPTLGEMIVLAKKYDGVLECYIVNTDRNDTRFSCEGIFFPNISRKNLIAIVSKYPDADEMNVDDNNLKLWWD